MSYQEILVSALLSHYNLMTLQAIAIAAMALFADGMKFRYDWVLCARSRLWLRLIVPKWPTYEGVIPTRRRKA